MKAAICFFGVTRNMRLHTLESLQANLIQPIANNYECKKFAHFITMPAVSNPRTGEENVPVDAAEGAALGCDVWEQTPQSELNEHLDFSRIEAYGDVWEDDFNSLRNLMRQLYSLRTVTELMLRSGEHFDLVVSSRVDIRLTGPLRLPRIRAGCVYTPWFARGGGCNDRFGLGTMEAMVLYGRRFDMMQAYCEALRKPLHAERFLKWCLRQHHLRDVELTSLEFCRVRADGSVPKIDRKLDPRWKLRLRRQLVAIKNAVWGDGA